MSLTAAEAWALAAKVYAVEALRSGPLDAVELREQAAALLEHARRLDDSDDLICRAQAYLETPVKPAVHFHAPRPIDARAVVGSLRGKPSRRRGTKPASLPQRMAAACHTLKEP